MVAIVLFDLRSRNWRLRSVFREMSPETLWLLYWSVGGLIVMSLIPSKRVDRIFPVIPPLCLLLAAQSGGRRSSSRSDGFPAAANLEIDGCPSRRSLNEAATLRPYAAITLIFAILFSGGYTGWKVITGYRDHRNVLAVFGRNVRQETEAHHWRYEVVSAKDEGLLLYLRKTHFVEPADAIREWNAANLEALVASEEKAVALMHDLQGAAVSQLQSNEQEQHQQSRGYVLITR